MNTTRSWRQRLARLLALLTLVALLLGVAPGLGRPAAALAAGPSGVAAPTADLPNFKLVQSEDFASSLAVGQWPGPYADTWGTYGEWPDTAGQGGVNSGYSASRVVSVRDGMLDYYLHTENGRTLAAALLPVAADHLYGRVSLRMRADPVPGYKTAFLYWPNSEVWPRDGEIDYPEGNLTGGVEGYVHHQGATRGSDQAWVPTGARYPDWHTYTIEWTPGSVQFFLDGVHQGGTTERVPNTKMHFVLQAERCLDGCAAPADASGHLQIDWVAVWDYAPGTPGGETTPIPAAPASPVAFGDVPAGHPTAEAIGQLAARGIVRGYDPSTFGPTDPVLRAQMAAMLVRAMGWGGQDPANPFTDRDGVDDEMWRAIATLADHGVARGYGGGLYGTTDPVLNAQVVSFVTKAMVSAGHWQPQPDDGRTYPNVAAGSGHRQDLVTYVHYAGAVHGAEDTTGAFAGWDEQSSRAWFAFVLWRALESHFGVGLVP